MMGKIALNITSGEVRATPTAAPHAAVWALAAIHACTNHACTAPSGSSSGGGGGGGGRGANVYAMFVCAPEVDTGVIHQCIAKEPLSIGEELTLCYATDATAREAGYTSVRAFLKERRLFDCQCATCT